MIGFWILATLLLLAAYAFFIPFLGTKFGTARVDRRRLNLLLHKQRKEELAREAGGDSESLAMELDRDLLGDLTSATESVPAANLQTGRGALMGALIAAPALAFVVYTQVGRPDLTDFKATPQAKAEESQENKDFQGMIDRLAERLNKEPNDVKGWMLLGRSYSETEQFDKAVDAYEHAVGLEPDNLDAKAFLAETLAQVNQGSFKGRPMEMAVEILVKDPKHQHALWLAGAASAEAGEPAKAVQYLQKLKDQLPADGADAKYIDGVMARLQGKPASETQATAADQPTAAAAPKKSIQVKVTVASGIKSKAAADDTVFIFARAAKGPPMPLAIVRKKVSDLPVEVTLDDSMAMVPGMNLSAFEQLVIGARVSKTGQALPSAGDIQGLTEPTAVQSGKSYSVEINQEVK